MTQPAVIFTRTDRGTFVNLAAATRFEVTQLDEQGRWGTMAMFGAGDPSTGVDYVTVPGLDADSKQEAFAKFQAFARDVLHARVYQPEGT